MLLYQIHIVYVGLWHILCSWQSRIKYYCIFKGMFNSSFVILFSQDLRCISLFMFWQQCSVQFSISNHLKLIWIHPMVWNQISAIKKLRLFKQIIGYKRFWLFANKNYTLKIIKKSLNISGQTIPYNDWIDFKSVLNQFCWWRVEFGVEKKYQ